jgi:hypothetical protein
MAPRPQDTCVSVWLSPEQIEQLDTLVRLRKRWDRYGASSSRSGILRLLIDDAVRRATGSIESTQPKQEQAP